MNNTVLKSNQNTYFLRYSINAHCEAEELLGFPITKLSEESAGITTFRTLLYVGLKHAGISTSMDQAGEIMEEVIKAQGMEYFSKQVSEAIQKGLNQQNNDQFKSAQSKKKN